MSNTNRRRQAVKDWFEKNPSKTQFYLTICVLLVTAYFSAKSLSETQKQYQIAKGQLDLSLKQVKNQEDQREQDLRLNHLKDIGLAKKEKLDSERIAINDLQQRKYNEFQNQVNSQQLKINKQQLFASQTQAKVADAQFKFQKSQSANQFEDDRPIFIIDSVRIDSSKSSYKPNISFHVINVGKRTPHVDSSVIAIWNRNIITCAKVEKHLTNIDMRNISFSTEISMYRDCLKDINTIYYINVIYRDTYTNELKSKHNFFRYYIYPRTKSFGTRPASDEETVDFINFLKVNEKKLGRLL